MGDREYEVISIQTTLANHSIGPGDRKGQAVKCGGAIFFHKHTESGIYSLFEEDAEESEVTVAAGCVDRTPPSADYVESGGENKPDRIARAFVDFLREKPFRISLHRGDRRAWYPEQPVVGWEPRLNTYLWDGVGWDETALVTNRFVERLNLLKTSTSELRNRQEEAGKIYKDIAAWCNPRATSLPDHVVLEHLDKVWASGIDTVDSTLTNLYAFARPDEYVIYDSRVGTAILSIAEDIYRYRTFSRGNEFCPAGSIARIESVNLYFRSVYPNIGIYDGAGGSRPRAFRFKDWPTGYRNVSAQLDANDLCCRIVRHLNKIGEGARKNWSLREVEAVLFMEGY